MDMNQATATSEISPSQVAKDRLLDLATGGVSKSPRTGMEVAVVHCESDSHAECVKSQTPEIQKERRAFGVHPRIIWTPPICQGFFVCRQTN